MAREYALSKYFSSITLQWAGGASHAAGYKIVPQDHAVNQRTTEYFKGVLSGLREGTFRVYGGEPRQWTSRSEAMRHPPPAKAETNWARVDVTAKFKAAVESLDALVDSSTYALDNAELFPGGMEQAVTYLLGPDAERLDAKPVEYKGTGRYADDLIPSGDDEPLREGEYLPLPSVLRNDIGRTRKGKRKQPESESEWSG